MCTCRYTYPVSVYMYVCIIMIVSHHMRTQLQHVHYGINGTWEFPRGDTSARPRGVVRRGEYETSTEYDTSSPAEACRRGSRSSTAACMLSSLARRMSLACCAVRSTGVDVPPTTRGLLCCSSDDTADRRIDIAAALVWKRALLGEGMSEGRGEYCAGNGDTVSGRGGLPDTNVLAKSR